MFKYVYQRFLFSYILILVIPLLSNYFIYHISFQKLTEQVIEQNTDVLIEAQSSIDRKNDEINRLIYQLATNPDIHQLMFNDSEDKTILFNTYKVLNSIRPFWHTNTLFKDFYIYFRNLNLIISPESAYFRPLDYFQIKAFEKISYEDWEREINQNYYSGYNFSFEIANEKKTYIPYIQSIPLNTKTNPKANIVILIDRDEIATPLRPIYDEYKGATFIYDKYGNIIFYENHNEIPLIFESIEEFFNYDRKMDDFLIIETKSSNDWTYVAVIPKVKITEDIKYIQTISLIIALITIITGIIFALLFSYNNSIPLKRLIGIMSISNSKKIKNPYNFLHNNIKNMIANNHELKAQLQNQLPIIQDIVIRKLIHGEIASSEEAINLIQQSQLSFKGSYGLVGVIKIIGLGKKMDKEMLEEMNVAHVFIEKELNHLFKDGVVHTKTNDFNQLVFLITYPNPLTKQEEKRIDNLLVHLIQRLEKKYNLRVLIGIGSEFNRYIDIHESYEEAKESLPFIHSIDQQSSIQKFVEQLGNKKIDFYFPIEMEFKLLNAISEGNINEVEKVFFDINSESSKYRELNYRIGLQLLSSLKGTIFRVLSKNNQLNQLLIEQILAQLEEVSFHNDTFYDNLKYLKDICLNVTQNIKERKSAADELQIQKIKECIKEYFSDPNLTIHKIAELVGLPEKMVPTIFKEHTGINISDYIEDVRIYYAKSQLLYSSDTIEVIAKKSGYNSAHSFRRAFKRNTGTSPSNYRNLMKSK